MKLKPAAWLLATKDTKSTKTDEEERAPERSHAGNGGNISHRGTEEKTLRAYAADPRRAYANHARLVLGER